MNNKLKEVVLRYLSNGPKVCIWEKIKTTQEIREVEDITWKELINVFLRNKQWRKRTITVCIKKSWKNF
jgi:hypothetical protein